MGLIESLYINEGLIYVLNEYSELIILDNNFNIVSKIEYPEKNAAKVFGVNNSIYVELNDKIYDL